MLPHTSFLLVRDVGMYVQERVVLQHAKGNVADNQSEEFASKCVPRLANVLECKELLLECFTLAQQ